MRKKPVGIAIVSPGGYAPDNEAVKRAITELEKQNCRVYNYYRHDKRYQRFGAKAVFQLNQIQEAIENPNVDIVLSLRGGYGMSRLLPYLNFKKCATSKKLFVGHSDFTAFQLALMQETRAVSFAGPMFCNDFTRDDKSDFTFQHFWKCLNGPDYTIDWKSGGNPKVNVSGTLWGGNLTMITHLLGTKWMPKVENGILFVEDVNEHPYRIERMILQLYHSGILASQHALVFGDFSGYSLTEYDNGYDFETMLDWLRSYITVPIVTGLPFGHVRDKVTLPVGAPACLISDNQSVNLKVNAYPTLFNE